MYPSTYIHTHTYAGGTRLQCVYILHLQHEHTHVADAKTAAKRRKAHILLQVAWRNGRLTRVRVGSKAYSDTVCMYITSRVCVCAHTHGRQRAGRGGEGGTASCNGWTETAHVRTVLSIASQVESKIDDRPQEYIHPRVPICTGRAEDRATCL